MLATRLMEYLDSHQVKYATISHAPAYTAGEIAAEAHISGKELAKTVMVKLDGQLAMAVLPADRKIDFQLLKEATGADHVELAQEQEFKDQFPDCEVGAMPPFGNLYGLPVYVEQSLAQDEEIVFNAGTHQDSICMKYMDFARLVRPRVIEFALERAA